MKIVSFNVPKTSREALRVQIDKLPHFYNQLHEHTELQLTHIIKGEGTLIAGDYVGRFAPNEMYLLGSRQPHVFRNDESYYKSKGKIQAHSISLYFDRTYLGEHFWELDDMKVAKDFLEKSNRGFKVIGKTKELLEKELLKIQKQKGIDRVITFFETLKILTVSSELTSLGISQLAETFNPIEGKRMNDVIHFIFTQSNRKIYIKEVAAIANLSEEAFCRYFKIRTRKTFTHFLNEIRVSNACRLLQAKDIRISEACFKVGFTNLSQFNRVFKKITGKAPSSYLALAG